MKTPYYFRSIQKVGKLKTLHAFSIILQWSCLYIWGYGYIRVIPFLKPFEPASEFILAEIIALALFFPCFVKIDQNLELMVPITNDTLQKTLHGFQKDKLLGLDGWMIEYLIEI